jgi:hypothetical protein
VTDKLMLTVGGVEHVIEIRRGYMDVSHMGPVADPNWQYTDLAGHVHLYDRNNRSNRYPSLKWVPGEPYPCPYGAYDCCDSTHVDHHLACALCGERITPGTTPGGGVERMQTYVEYFLDGRRSSEEECRALFDAFKAEQPASVPGETS